MDRVLSRDHVALGCRNGDVDFTDVFGGPPRRSSIHEIRCSFSEATDSYAMNGDEETRRGWSGLGEKPVFGEEVLCRRRYQSDDFFDDIFRGDESVNSTPRKHDRASFSSPPGSRVLSPSHPVPLKAEFSATSSLPSEFSLPAKLTKGMDLPTFGSNARSPIKYKDVALNGISIPYSSSVTTLSRFSSEAIRCQEETKYDLTSSHRSPSSLENSLSTKESSNLTKSDETETVAKLKRNSSCSEVPTNINQFHFSIYKWASKGVPLMMPLRLGNNSRSKIMDNGSIECENVTRVLPEDTSPNNDSPFFDDHKSANTMSFRMEKEQEGNDSILKRGTQNRAEPCQIVDKSILPSPKSETRNSLQTIVKNVASNTILPNMEDRRKQSSPAEIGLYRNIDKDIHVVVQENQKSEMRTVGSLFDDNYNETGKDEAKKKSGGKETVMKSTKKLNVDADLKKNVNKQEQRTASDSADINTAVLQALPVNSGNKLGSSRFKGKVDKFVKIFNQEASSKPIIEVNTQIRSSRWKDRDVFRPEKEESVGTTAAGEKMQTSVDKNKTFADSFIKVDDNLKVSEKKRTAIKTSNKLSSDTSLGLKDSLTSSTESIHTCSTSIAGDTDDFFQHEFLIKEISEDESKLMQPSKDQEDFQAADTKIQKWSKGKEGNIRSLLSTLQYVLWPESGWKPVPLVDIIEGNAVKRAYQKALLCLHPDKLQQKGAASHQKYVAEKVFDILQEAWIHFNSLSSLS